MKNKTNKREKIRGSPVLRLMVTSTWHNFMVLAGHQCVKYVVCNLYLQWISAVFCKIQKPFRILHSKLLLPKLLTFTVVSRLRKGCLACKETMVDFCSALLEFKFKLRNFKYLWNTEFQRTKKKPTILKVSTLNL